MIVQAELRWNWSIILPLLVLNCCVSSVLASAPEDDRAACSFSRYQWIETQIGSGDGHGHGPDIASSEWFAVIEFRLGLADTGRKPEPGSLAWCRWVEDALAQPATQGGAQASFSCTPVRANSSLSLICNSPSLSALDRQLAQVYAAAIDRAGSAANTLKAMQRGWIRGRDACWKEQDEALCIEQAYRRRIAALETQYALVPHSAPRHYVCGDQRKQVYQVVFYQTQPPTLLAKYQGQTALMFQQPAASGSHYTGRNESLRQHQGETLISWGFDSPERRCQRVPEG